MALDICFILPSLIMYSFRLRNRREMPKLNLDLKSQSPDLKITDADNKEENKHLTENLKNKADIIKDRNNNASSDPVKVFSRFDHTAVATMSGMFGNC